MRICGLRWGRAEVGGTADPVNASTPLSMDDRPGRERSTSPLTLDYSPEFMLLTMPNESSSLSRGAPVSATPALRIGDVAAAAGVSVDALRFYERRGLLKPAARRASGYREYTSEAVGLVRFIRRAQSLGFSLAEVEDLVRLRERAWAGRAPEQLRDAAVAKVKEIDRRLRELRTLRDALGRLVTACDNACAGTPERTSARSIQPLDCPLLEAFEDDAACADDGAAVVPRLLPPMPGRTVRKVKRSPADTSSRSRRTK